MRFALIGLGAVTLSSAVALASPAISNELMLPLAGKALSYAAPDGGGGAVPSITRGQSLGIACANADRAGADVRVVMQVARNTDDEPTGYDAVLATHQHVSHGAVHVQVPDVPGLSDHTVSVKVFVMDSRGTHICDGGRVRIG